MCSPFFNYDMYSYPTHPQPYYEVVRLQVNGKPLEPKDFSPQQWDNLMVPLQFWSKQQSWNSMIFNTGVRRFLPIHDSVPYINMMDETVFYNYHKRQVLRMAGAASNRRVAVVKDTHRLAQQYVYTP